MHQSDRLKAEYPWIQTPLVVGAPMRRIALAELAVGVSRAGGLGFIGAGTSTTSLTTHLLAATSLLAQSAPLPSAHSTLPIGVGVINWGAELGPFAATLAAYRPAAVWFFAPASAADLVRWAAAARDASPHTRVWVQVGSVGEARDVARACRPDVLVVQGTDAGGHGLARGAGLLALLPERGAAAALVLGAAGVVMGTRFLAAPEAVVSKGYRDEVLRASDGGQTTVRTKVWDQCRGTTGWAETHNGRGIINKTYTDALAGMDVEENKKMYEEDLKRGDEGWGEQARLCTYAGSAVGLVKEVKGAGRL
ncbi:inosine monophosphate dehydrogenase [Lizonia empirigonia]|nr:inosine monophosphate dehydrogenase [Lizonia empirigonia]